MEPAVLSTKQLMEYLGIGRNKAYEIIHQIGFPIDGLWNVSRKKVDEWIEEQSKGGHYV